MQDICNLVKERKQLKLLWYQEEDCLFCSVGLDIDLLIRAVCISEH